jgi:sterol desaturase/sphingolipid hydroxylase (fatty acid hydroxylase superfamily)
MRSNKHYPPFHRPLVNFFTSVVRDSMLIGTILCWMLYKPYIKVVQTLYASGWNNEAIIFTLLTSLVHSFMYIFVNGFFLCCDYFGMFKEYKLNRRDAMIPKKELILSTLKEAFVSQIFITPLFSFISFPVFKYFGLTELDSNLPSLMEIAKTMAIAHVFNDFTFYWSHRLLHTKFFYGKFHKQHHQYIGTMGIAAEYAHPVEALFSNLIPSLGGVVFFGCHHPLAVLVWIVSFLIWTVILKPKF